MAKTKNSTKCAMPKHKPRVTRKQHVAKTSLVSKKKTSSGRTYKRGEDVDFNELTHKVTCGGYVGFKGQLLSKDSEGNATFCLLINPRGKAMKESKEITLNVNDLEDVNSADMLSLVNVDGAEEEDKALLEYEKKTWECGTCKSKNSNEGSYCIQLHGGKVCGAPKPFDGKFLGWGGCFKQNQDETWTCITCSLNNSLAADQCIACETPKNNKESPTAVLRSNISDADGNIASISAGVKNYSISGKGKRRKLEDDSL